MLKMKRILAFMFSIIMFFSGLFASQAIAHTHWELTGWSVSSVDPSEYTMTLAFDKNSFSGRSAVNLYGGSYSAIRERLILSGIWSTKIAGPPEAMEAEQIYFELLGQVKKYSMNDSELRLLDASGNELLTFGISATLANTEWKLAAWSVSSTDPKSYTMTLNFDENGFFGRSAVNNYFGSYEAGTDGTLEIGMIGSTEMAGPPEAMQAEFIYFELLGQVKKYTLTASALMLLDENGNELLIFEKA